MKKGFKDYIRKILKNFYIIILLMVLSLIFVFWYANKQSVYYISDSTILIEEKNIDNMKTYEKYLESKDLIDNVKTSLELPMGVDELKNDISINYMDGTKLMKISVKTTDYDLSNKIDNQIIKEFSKSIVSIYPDLKVYTIDKPNVENSLSFDLYNYITIALIASLFTGIIIALLFGVDIITINNNQDLKKFLGLKNLGIIPNNNDVDYDKKKKKLNTNKSNIKIIDDSSSIVSESYRMVRTNLDFLDLKVINFTSTSVGEGKSETISNVAASFSMIGKKVLLVDCDLRKPKIHKNFGLKRALGLTDIVVYNRLDEYKNMIQEYKIPNTSVKIDVLSAGSKVSNPSELLSSKRFESFISKLKEDYDLVLIDCPPVSLMSDASIISKIVDGTCYVIESGRINYMAINNSIEQLRSVDANIIGGVVTKVNITSQKKLYGDKYGYYYDNYIS